MTPSELHPPGVESNLIDPPSAAYVSIILMVLYLSLSTPLVIVRILTRHFVHKKLWWDDCRVSTPERYHERLMGTLRHNHRSLGSQLPIVPRILHDLLLTSS